MTTARENSLVGCHHCNLIVAVGPDDIGLAPKIMCPRCSSVLHQRKPNSIARSWALLIAAVILYIPANTIPIMTVTSFGEGSPDTIMSGVIHLLEADQIPIAALVFFASIVVPIFKIVMISMILISVQFKSGWRAKDRTLIYRLMEVVGRWSMIDIFMISILVGLVKLGNIATIEVGFGAVAFAAVVVLTMFSATYFDPRLIWDHAQSNELMED